MSCNPCDFCKHYKEVSWKYSGKGKISKGCGLAITRNGNDGYGPFYSHAVCINDSDQKPLANIFESASESDNNRQIETIGIQRNKIQSLESEIISLNEAILTLANKKPQSEKMD